MRLFKTPFLSVLFLLSALAAGTLIFLAGVHSAKAGTGDNLSGYAWSSTIGWLSFNCVDPGTCAGADYGVNVGPTGALSGYAWSPNIGWVSFNAADVSGCPAAPCAPNLNKTTGEVSGWALALAGARRTDGWDGWVSLRGTAADSSAYGVSVNNCSWEGWAWGGPVVGWLSFNGASYGITGTGDACEGPQLNECEDSIDNLDPEDTLKDVGDPGCYDEFGLYSPLDNNEVDTLPTCGNNFDDDGDGRLDCADSGCWISPGVCNPNGGSESDSRPQCSNWFDDDGDGKTDAADPGCYTNDTYDPLDNDETDTLPICSNNFDDDNDDLIDEFDPGCWTDPSNPYVDADNPGSYDPNRSSERRIRFREELPQ